MKRPEELNVLIACEESQAICTEMRKLGVKAYSCDIQDCSGGHPEWHIKGDVIPLLNGNCDFVTMGGQTVSIKGKWDLIIAHPPCTFLTVSGNRWFNVAKYGDKAIKRAKDRDDAETFFMMFINADCDHIAVENPIGIMSTRYRKPDVTIQPWMFGDNFNKTTCLWIKGLPDLVPQCTTPPEMEWKEWIDKNTGRKKRQNKWYYDALCKCRTSDERSRLRSKTFPGIAKAIAEQWIPYLCEVCDG